jgi:WD40 repeat protein
MAVVHVFDKQSAIVKSIVFLRAQPGSFTTSGDKVGVVKIWNVSQRAPISQIKVGVSGISTSIAFPAYPDWLAIAFANGSVGVVDVATRKMKLTTSPGHCETIFDVCFHPRDPDLLATCSYDGYAKLWRIPTGESCREMFSGQGDVLYGASFSSAEVNQLCAISSHGMLLGWHVESGEEVFRIEVHKGKGLRVEWDHKSNFIASGGADEFAAITDPQSATIVKKVKHPDQVVGVSWHPTAELALVTACQDCNIHTVDGQECACASACTRERSRVCTCASI